MKNQLYIIEFIFTTKNGTIKVYNLMVYGDNDYAIKKGNKILFFSRLDDCASLWEEMKLNQQFILPKKISLSCDINSAIKLIEKRQVDRNSNVLNCINTLSDLINTINYTFPIRYRKSLFALANHLTFSKNINLFFVRESYKRDFIIKGLINIEEIIIKNSLLYKQNKGNKFNNLSKRLSLKQKSKIKDNFINS